MASVKEAIEKELYKPYFPHSTSHWLGLDVHDAGDYRAKSSSRSNRLLQEGMIITIEPGLYIPASPDIPSQYWNIGIRIEDDILITRNEPEVLTKVAPKEVEEIEACMAKSRSGTWW